MRPLISVIKFGGSKSASGLRLGAGRRPPRRRQLWICLMMLSVGLGAGTGAWVLRESGLIERTHKKVAGEISKWTNRQLIIAGLTAKHVFVTGREETSKAQVLAAIDIKPNESILKLNLRAARQRLLKLSWVETAQIERRLPDTIIVKLQERKALALWQYNGEHALIDLNGQIITRLELNRFAHLPIVVGRGAPGAASELIVMLARKPSLYARVHAAVRIGGRRWDIRLKNGIKVHLPEARPFAAWVRLAQLELENRIFEKDVAAIDLRLPDRLVVRLTPGAVSKRNKKGKET